MKITNPLTYKTSGTSNTNKLYLACAPDSIQSTVFKIGSRSIATHSYAFIYNYSGTISTQWFESSYNSLFQVFTPSQLAYTSVSFPKFYKKILVAGGFYVNSSTITVDDNVRCNIISRYNNASYQEAKASNSTMTHIIVENSGTIEIALDGTYPTNESLKVFTFLATPLGGDCNYFRVPIKSIKVRGYNNTISTTLVPRSWAEEIVLG